MVAHSYYEEDPRVRREAEALVARGRPVDVVALRRPGDGPSGTLNGVRITRIDVQRHQGAGAVVYLREYLSFLVRAGWAATRAHRRRRYAVVQVHSLPDFLVFAALPLKLVGVPVVLDLHEAMPEFFKTRFPNVRSPLVRRALLLEERLSIAFAGNRFTGSAEQTSTLRGSGAPPKQRTGSVSGSRNADTATFDVRFPGLTPNAHVVLELTSPTSFAMRISSLGATLTKVDFHRPAAR
jgi:hypothetical protein